MAHAYREITLIIGKSRIGAAERHRRLVVDPATGETIGALPIATADDIRAAAETAGRAFEQWRKTSSHQRQSILRAAAAALRARREQLAWTITTEQGKPLAESRGETDASAETLEWFADEARRSYGRIIPSRFPGNRQLVEIEPVGPVAAFAPWNFPLINSIRKIAPALAAGCSIVIKPAEETPGATLIAVECLLEAGLPEGVVSVLYGNPAEISEGLIRSPEIRKISFTGSVPVGQSLAALAATHGKRSTMELGGHAPVIVLDDVDAAQVAAMAAAGKFRNAGQVCNGATRFYVQRGVYDAFLEAFADYARAIVVGDGRKDGVQMGPLANDRRVVAMERFTADAQRRGGGVIGGARLGNVGNFFQPTIFHDLDPEADAYRTEPFGPLALVAPFEKEAEALQRANDINVGLSSFVFSDSAKRQRRMIDGLQAGLVGVNTFTVSFPETPFGGIKESGHGHEGGSEGLEPYLVKKFVHVA
ncbi:NAD-dependent succinate-semialdehyde dehydrogenase [Mesorhizobium sp. B2-7-1]|uniref:NAD-dependent succinate-semialdehyde dehydrogenase n=1 Tax=Mesorhizobium sp. B2-7-1 TaxID=2589909 RepID=UPI0011283AEB|nr:NAD-dependent succinate-semialdehyde dehydrogenase [Mesorhizobium sp. B2-7-1]TPJ74586.1 NAD-dependent succinate-semialdehyde dehydrogenase [Mesorhizobium sp. B2-7-1]